MPDFPIDTIDIEAPNLSNKAHYTLNLRGGSINVMIDAATPLLGMILRIQDIDSLDDNPNLYQQVVNDIRAIQQSLEDKRYEPGVVVSFRYILCTFIDEVAMKRSWDSKTNWRKESLLVHFHNEAWGGEKIFVLLNRLMGEPHRYKDLLNFIYLCFCLGLRGRYSLNSANMDEFNQIFRRLYQQIQTLNNNENSFVSLNMQFDHSNYTPYKLLKKMTLGQILLGMLFVLVIVFGFYTFQLNGQSQNILKQLNELLK